MLASTTTFMWIERNGQLWPQKLYENMPRPRDVVIVAEVSVPDAQKNWKLDRLAEKYPAPVTSVVVEVR